MKRIIGVAMLCLVIMTSVSSAISQTVRVSKDSSYKSVDGWPMGWYSDYYNTIRIGGQDKSYFYAAVPTIPLAPGEAVHIDAAVLNYYVYTTYGINDTTPYTFTDQAFRITQSWNEGNAIKDDKTQWDLTTLPPATAEGYGTSTMTNVLRSAIPGWKMLVVTDLFQGWVDGKYPNYGVMVKQTVGFASIIKALYSRESGGSDYFQVNYSIVPAPIFTPGGPYISGPTVVTISSDTAGASIYYTTNGTVPTTSGTAYPNPVTVTVSNGMTLKAIAQAGSEIGGVTSVTYSVPSSYNRPWAVGKSDSITVDGSLSDWQEKDFVPLDKNYDWNGATDVSEAYYAAKWASNGKVYVAVKVKDTAHSFTDTYDDWNTRDAVEFYLHTYNNGDPAYTKWTTAQQYVVGIKGSDTTKVWTAMGGAGVATPLTGSSSDGIFSAAGGVNGEWIYYEIEMTPFTYLRAYTDGNTSTSMVSTLDAGDVIGLDVCLVGNDAGAGTYTGMKSENTKTGKAANWKQFGLHKLVEEDPFLVLQWGPNTPNGTTNSAYYLNDNIVDGNALGTTNGSGLWELDRTGNIIHSLSDTGTVKSAVKVGDYIYYALSSTCLYRVSVSTWSTPEQATVSNSASLASLATDGTYIYASTAQASGQVMKYSVDAGTGVLTLVWTTTGIDATGIRGLSYYDGATDYIYAVSGGRNPATTTGNTAHIYAIRTDTGAVTDMGAITHMGEAYQIVRRDNQLWVADCYNNADGQIYVYNLTNSTTLASTTPTTVCNPDGIGAIYGMAIDEGFVWLSTSLGKVYGYTFKETFIPGDANCDGLVDVGDLGILAANYGTTSGATWATGDFNNDGAVDVGDLGILAANYGSGSDASLDFGSDYAKAFGTTTDDADASDDTTNSSVCSALGLPLMAGLFLAGLMLVKLEE
jgi:hypothetical protein